MEVGAPPPAPRPGVRPDDGSDGGGTFRWGIQEPAAIVPPAVSDPHGVAVVDALFDSLTAWDPPAGGEGGGADAAGGQGSALVGAAAVHWGADASATTWTFQLRPGATFHDGSAVTAQDFKFAWEVAVGLDETGPGYQLRHVEGYEAVRSGQARQLAGVAALDDRTLQVRLSRPFADFPAVVAHPALGPVPGGVWTVDPAAFRNRPIGNGPFRAAEAWAHGRFIRLARYEGWRNGPRPRTAIDEVLFQIIDPDTAFVAFQQGRLDFTVLPPGALEEATARYGVSRDGYRGPGVLLGDEPVMYYLAFNVTRQPFDDPQVRRALSVAIDRSAVARDSLDGNLEVARSAVPPAIPGARPGTCQACNHSPAAARQVLAERGVRAVTLWFNRGGGHEAIAERVRRDLAEVGVAVSFRSVDFPRFLAALRSGEADLFRFGWTADHPTLDEALYPLFHSDGWANFGGYGDPEVDALLDQARATLDEVQRRQLYQRAEDLALGRDQAIAPLVTFRHRAVVSDRVVGFTYGPMGTANLAQLEVREPDAAST
ncbi:MAG: ABC transporter substrate-binding protein [Actinomycetota bacterium]|nr:ABC transporter substrate-binding protein [Actinomycetota bacterium]